MNKYIQSIKGKIPGTYKEVDIDLRGKNLIITGPNGCGKTCLLNGLWNKLKFLVIDKNSYKAIKQNAENCKKHLDLCDSATQTYDNHARMLNRHKKQLEEYQLGLPVDFSEQTDFIKKYDQHAAVCKIFNALRVADIKSPDSSKGLDTVKSEKVALANSNQRNNLEFSSDIEQHLVNLKVNHALAFV